MTAPDQATLTRCDDTQLLALCKRFWAEHQESEEAHSRFSDNREAIKAAPDCPPDASPLPDPVAYEVYERFMDERGNSTLCSAWNAALARAGATANAIFGSPAFTPQGIAAKFGVLKLAMEPGDRDSTVAVWQDRETAQGNKGWFNSVTVDLERLTGGAG